MPVLFFLAKCLKCKITMVLAAKKYLYFLCEIHLKDMFPIATFCAFNGSGSVRCTICVPKSVARHGGGGQKNGTLT